MSEREGSANCNFLLGDEINRASSKTQSSLLEVMEERQITVDGVTRKIPEPFMVLATQNPIESKGTNKLPEAQMDRFLFKLSIGYPTKEGEKEILNRFQGENPLKVLQAVATTDEIIQIQKQVEQVKVSDEIKELIINIVSYTRNNISVDLGASPRGSLALLKVSKAIAFMKDRDYVIPEDVVEMARDILCHRIILSSSARVKGITANEVILDCVNRAIKNTSKVLENQ
jgi:MoxR-like ATPase